MIRFRFSGTAAHPAPTAVIGLSDGNLDRLRAGLPIHIPAEDGIDLGVDLVIFHGATEVDMTRELEEKGLLPDGAAAQAGEAIRNRGRYEHTTTEGRDAR